MLKSINSSCRLLQLYRLTSDIVELSSIDQFFSRSHKPSAA